VDTHNTLRLKAAAACASLGREPGMDAKGGAEPRVEPTELQPKWAMSLRALHCGP
jgi:hypothetical protein